MVGSPDWLGQGYLGILITFIGIIILIFGFVLLYYGYIGSTPSNIPNDIRPSVVTADESLSDYNREGKEVGKGIDTDYKASELPKEAKRIKCSNCGHLDTKYGNYCTQCGSKL